MDVLKDRKLLIAVSIFVIVLVITGFVLYPKVKDYSINNFEDCAKYHPVQETFPERCTTSDGRTFVKVINAQPIEITGSVVCLPHKNQNGPQTLECAYGLKKGDDYYALRFPDTVDLVEASTAESIEIKGDFTSSNDPNEIYYIVGKIDVKSYTVLKKYDY